MGFNDIWIQLVMQCVTTVDFDVLINGRPGKKFKPTKGQRHGDPLSPYLFFIVSEVLSLLIQNASELGYIDGILVSGQGPCLSHLIFADDTVIFLKATKTNCNNIVKLLDSYCYASGQEVSLQKSTVYFSSNIPMPLSYELCDILHMPKVEDPGKYLDNLCRDIDAAIARFWWGQRDKERRIHWVSWEAWSSLLEGRKLLLQAAHWQIMSGDQTRIWVDRWLPKIPMGHPTPIQGISMDKNQRVSSIIQPDSRGWLLEVVDGFVHEEEREAISLTMLRDSRIPDRLIWPADRRGCIRSDLVINGFMTRLNIEDLGGHPHPEVFTSRYGKFATIMRKMWSMFSYYVLGRFGCGLESLLTLGWIRVIVGEVELFQKAKALDHTPSIPRTRQPPDRFRSWTPPSPYMLKINVDVSWQASCGRGAVGVIMRDHLGRCLAIKRKDIVTPRTRGQ
ncbi:hypothetical protein ACFX13_038573 [Malus domestica]